MKIFIKNFLCIGFLIQSTSSSGMFTALRNNRQLTTAARPSNRVGYNRLVQQRRYWQPVQVQKTPLISISYPNKNFLANGAAITESSYWLPNLLKYNSVQHKLDISDPMAKFTNELFQISPDGGISIVNNKNKVSYILTPEFFGVLRGAQKENLLDDPSVVKKIVALGQAEYTKMAGNNETMPQELQNEIKDFLVTMNEVNKSNPAIVQSLEDAYLFLRMNPSNSHDIIHYLLGFNHYAGILSEQQLKAFKDIVTQNDQSVPITDFGSNQNDREKFIDELSKRKTPSEQVKYAHENFPLAVSAMIQENRNRDLYSTKVRMNDGSYENKPKFSMCAESAFRDLFNNLFFDEELQIFDPLQFFPTLNINNKVLEFFNRYKHVGTINSDKNIGNDFLELVSGLDEIRYVHKDKYEISSIATEENLINLSNHFFSIQAKNLSDLGKMLSSERRSIAFKLVDGNNIKKIAVTIHDKKTNKKKNMSLYFQPGHSWFEVGNQDAQKGLIDSRVLLADFNNPQSRALLYIHPQPVIDSLFFRTKKNADDMFDASLYYAFPVNNDAEKSRLIRAIFSYDENNKQAVDYAYFLFDSLSNKSKILLKDIEKLNKRFSAYDMQTLKE